MAKIGLDPSRVTLPGAPHLINVKSGWLQYAYNRWAEKTVDLAEDGNAGAATRSAIMAMAGRIAPSATTWLVSDDRRNVTIGLALEQAIGGLEAQRYDTRRLDTFPEHTAHPTGRSGVVAISPSPGEGLALPPSGEATPMWHYVLGGGVFIAVVSLIAVFSPSPGR